MLTDRQTDLISPASLTWVLACLLPPRCRGPAGTCVCECPRPANSIHLHVTAVSRTSSCLHFCSVSCCLVTSNSSWSLCRRMMCGVKLNGLFPSSDSLSLRSCCSSRPSVRSWTASGCSIASTRFHWPGTETLVDYYNVIKSNGRYDVTFSVVFWRGVMTSPDSHHWTLVALLWPNTAVGNTLFPQT